MHLQLTLFQTRLKLCLESFGFLLSPAEGRRAEPRSHALGDAAGCRAEATSEDGQRGRIAPAADTAMGLTRGAAAVIEENCVRTEAGR
jgi:hypothetical protein